MANAPLSTQLDCLREARDSRQRTYAHAKQNCVMGLASQAAYEEARDAYLDAQFEYRKALLGDKVDRLVREISIPGSSVTIAEVEAAKAAYNAACDNNSFAGNRP